MEIHARVTLVALALLEEPTRCGSALAATLLLAPLMRLLQLLGLLLLGLSVVQRLAGTRASKQKIVRVCFSGVLYLQSQQGQCSDSGT